MKRRPHVVTDPKCSIVLMSHHHPQDEEHDEKSANDIAMNRPSPTLWTYMPTSTASGTTSAIEPHNNPRLEMSSHVRVEEICVSAIRPEGCWIETHSLHFQNSVLIVLLVDGVAERKLGTSLGRVVFNEFRERANEDSPVALFEHDQRAFVDSQLLRRRGGSTRLPRSQ